MLGAACYYYFASFFIGKPYGIANQVPPCAGRSADQYCVIFAFLHFMNQQCPGVIDNISRLVKVIAVKRNKFQEYMLAGRKAHALTPWRSW